MNCYSFYARDMITGTFDIKKLELKKPPGNSCSSDNKCGEMITFLRRRISLYLHDDNPVESLFCFDIICFRAEYTILQKKQNLPIKQAFRFTND